MDMVVATLALLLLLPVFLLIAILIKVDTAGPVFFVQERVGARRRSKRGRTVWKIENFRCYKFRSMVQDADPTAHQAYIKAFVNGSVQASDEGSPKFKLSNDPRVTRVGHILRKSSLDELPQLVNVLKGEMSLVGPRPLPTYEVAEYQAWHRERLAALPGITGLWQVQGRCEVTFEEQVQMDIEYVRKQSLWQDIKILFSTIPAVVSGRGAE
jgi:lipopolysaccharide/colanic/teichoic acid biosynthesis glycosyltransferase